MSKKVFPIGDLLSITTGRLVSPTHMDGIYAILNHMTGDNLFTHQLGRASDECKPWLLRWFPELAEVDALLPGLSKMVAAAADTREAKGRACAEWIDEVRRAVPALKAEYAVDRIPQDDHETKDPVAELEEMVGKNKVIVVKA